jgi:hypothetical protein
MTGAVVERLRASRGGRTDGETCVRPPRTRSSGVIPVHDRRMRQKPARLTTAVVCRRSRPGGGG